MKIIVFGKNGQLGSEIFKLGNKLKHNKILGFSHDELNIKSKSLVKEVIKKYNPNMVINAVALHAKYEAAPEKLFSVNTFPIYNLAEICNANNIKLITYSTDYVFDGKKGSPYEEEDVPSPLQIYGLSKYTSEIIALNYAPESIVIRTCGLYGGKRGSKSKGNFVLNFLKEASALKEIAVSAEQIVSPTYAVDLALASFKLMEKRPLGGIYHLANSGFCSWAEFSKEIIKIRNMNIRVKFIDRKGLSGGIRRPIFSALKNSKAKALGIELPSWKNALQRYLVYLQNSND